MRWEDERYVRLYTRDTVSWKLLPWQARVVLPLVLRKLDRTGFLDIGEHGVAGLAAVIEIPLEVVEVGMTALLGKSGPLAMAGNVLVMPNFMEAQECTHSGAQRQREFREKRLAAGMERVRSGNSDKWVTAGNAGNERVTPSIPSVPSVPSVLYREKTSAKKTSRPPKGLPDPRLSPLTQELVEDFERARGEKYLHSGAKDAVALKAMLGAHPPEEIRAKWGAGIRNKKFPRVSTIAQLRSMWNDIAATSGAAEDEWEVPAGYQDPDVLVR